MTAMMGGVVGLQYLLQDAGANYFGQRNTDNSYRVLAGARGNVGDWNWETAFASAGLREGLRPVHDRSGHRPRDHFRSSGLQVRRDQRSQRRTHP
ncbi:hypothetical protein G6F59_018669 [Rhizopus arrhizus]|nr:hypothetical protein G6F59_018669 [Rhizopus arrhizus]